MDKNTRRSVFGNVARSNLMLVAMLRSVPDDQWEDWIDSCN
jgi:hypothetical protein